MKELQENNFYIIFPDIVLSPAQNLQVITIPNYLCSTGVFVHVGETSSCLDAEICFNLQRRRKHEYIKPRLGIMQSITQVSHFALPRR